MSLIKGILLLLFIDSCVCGGPGDTDNCNGYVGVFQLPNVNCSPEYYECDEEGIIQSYTCESGYMLSAAGSCENVESIEECETALLLPKELDCAGKNGVAYSNPLKQCSVHYYTCNMESVSREKCKKGGTRFDPISQKCLFKEYVDVCGGKSTTLPPLITPQTKVPSEAVDCKYLPDGDYSNPADKCSNFFIACSNGEAIVKMCGEGTMYDSTSNRCLFRKFIEPCGGVATTKDPDREVVHEVPFPFSCLNVEDGLYSNSKNPCSSEFAQCSNGLVFYQKCNPANLRFDPETKECQNSYYVPVCGGMKTSKTTAPPTNGSSTTEQPSDMNCNGVVDGRYPDPKNSCSQRFFTCVSGNGIEQGCAENTKFDAQSSSCLFEHYVESCGGIPTTTEEPTTKVTTSNTVPNVPFEFQCLGKFDNIFPDVIKCSSHFIQCANGVGYYKQCHPSSLKYDIISRKCLQPAYVQACGGSNTSIKPNETDSTANPQTQTPAVVDLDCFSLADGYYEDPLGRCSKRFFVCSSGNVIEQACVQGTFFDKPSNSCQEMQYTAACGGLATTTAHPTKPTPAVTPYVFDCSSRLDGDYENPHVRCSSEYVSCASGRTFFRKCNPPTLKYDDISKSCLERQYVMWCGGVATTKGTTEKPASRPPSTICNDQPDGYYRNPLESCSELFYSCVGGNADKLNCPSGTKYDRQSGQCLNPVYVEECGGIATTTLAPNASTTGEPVLLTCGERDDGNYPDPIKSCSNVFYTCASGLAFRKKCGALSLMFDYPSDSCLSASYVRACGGSPTTTSEKPVANATTDGVPIPRFNCIGLAQGEYANPMQSCSGIFFVCNGRTGGLPQFCAPTTYFDQELRRCDFFDKIPECSGTPRPTTKSTIGTTQPTKLPTTPPVYDCTGKSEGNHPDPKNDCSPIYYTCAHQLDRVFEWRCPGKTYYDVELNQCLFYHQVPECSGTPRTTKEPTSKGTTPVNLFDCSNKEDGNYVLPGLVCPDHFYQCANKRSFYTICPGVLKYKTEDDACVSAAEVKGC